MSAWARVDINAYKGSLLPHMATVKSSFLECFTKCCIIWPFPEFNVTPRLQPHLERFVLVEQHPSSTHHKT
jgi:hypothetical protein